MERELRHLEMAWFGLVAVATVVMVVLRQEAWLVTASAWLEKWQTIVAAFIALAGAWLTVRKIREQITQVDRHERGRLERAHQASRATLSLTLSHIATQSLIVMRSLNSLDRKLIGSPEEMKEIDIKLEFGASASDLRDFLMTTDDRRLIGLVHDLLSNIQVFKARMEDFGASNRTEVEARMLDGAIIHSLAEALFEYARRETDEPPNHVSWERARLAMRFARIDEHSHRILHNRLKHKERSGEFLWKCEL